jgi:hypothetical protein
MGKQNRDPPEFYFSRGGGVDFFRFLYIVQHGAIIVKKFPQKIVFFYENFDVRNVFIFLLAEWK